MTPKQYQPVIAKALKSAKPGTHYSSPETLAEFVVRKMETYEEMFELASEGGLILAGSGREPSTSEPAIISSSDFDLGDVSQRVVSPQQSGTVQYTEDQIVERKKEALQNYNRILPLTLSVQPQGFTSPVVLNRHVLQTHGAIPILKIAYAQPGADPHTQSAMTQVDVTEAPRSVKSIVDEVTQAAHMIMSPTQRKVEPRFSSPPPGSLGETLQGAPNDETDRNSFTDESWGQSVVGRGVKDIEQFGRINKN
jgi:hypothetical protein